MHVRKHKRNVVIVTKPVSVQRTRPCRHNASCSRPTELHPRTTQRSSDGPKPDLQSTIRLSTHSPFVKMECTRSCSANCKAVHDLCQPTQMEKA